MVYRLYFAGLFCNINCYKVERAISTIVNVESLFFLAVSYSGCFQSSNKAAVCAASSYDLVVCKLSVKLANSTG